MTNSVLVCGSFDDLRSPDVRFFEEASRLGPVHVLLWSDELVRVSEGREPKFPLEERRYLVEALRFVNRVTPVDVSTLEPAILDMVLNSHDVVWADQYNGDRRGYQQLCSRFGMKYWMIPDAQVQGFPYPEQTLPEAGSQNKKVIVTGCYDWLHSGHIRFFEEVSQLGDLYVIVGHDENVRLLKGPGHPLFSQAERRYMVAAVRYVKSAMISSGKGWVDAEPEIALLQPDMYAVNEDGDKPEKREFCKARGIDYVVLKRIPKDGLPRRESTDLRGF